MYLLFLSSRRRNTEPKPKHAYIKVCAGFDNNVNILSNDIHQNLRHCNPCWSTWRPVISNQSVHMCEFALNSSCVLTASKLGECGQKIDVSGPFTPLDDMARSVSRDRSLRRQMTWQGDEVVPPSSVVSNLNSHHVRTTSPITQQTHPTHALAVFMQGSSVTRKMVHRIRINKKKRENEKRRNHVQLCHVRCATECPF